MKVGLDTSAVLRLLVREPLEQHERTLAFLDSLVQEGGYAVVSDLVVSEAYFALCHHYGFKKEQALGALATILESGEIIPTGNALKILRTPGLATAKPGFVDRLIHADYLTGADAVATFEKASKKLPSTQVL